MLRKFRSLTKTQKNGAETFAPSNLRVASTVPTNQQQVTPISNIGSTPQSSYGPYGSPLPHHARDTSKFSRSHSRGRILLARLFHLGESRSRHHSDPTTPAEISAAAASVTPVINRLENYINSPTSRHSSFSRAPIDIISTNPTIPRVLMDGIVIKLSSTKLWHSKPSYLVVLAMPSHKYILRQYRKEGDDVPIREFTLSYDDVVGDLPRDPKAEPTDISHCFQLVTRERSRPFKLAAHDVMEKERWVQTIRYCIACLRTISTNSSNSHPQVVPHQLSGYSSFQSLSLSSAGDASSSIHSDLSTPQELNDGRIHPMISFTSSSGLSASMVLSHEGSDEDFHETHAQAQAKWEAGSYINNVEGSQSLEEKAADLLDKHLEKKLLREVAGPEVEEEEEEEEDEEAAQGRGNNNNNNEEEQEAPGTPGFRSASSSSCRSSDGTVLPPRAMTPGQLSTGSTFERDFSDNDNNSNSSLSSLNSSHGGGVSSFFSSSPNAPRGSISSSRDSFSSNQQQEEELSAKSSATAAAVATGLKSNGSTFSSSSSFLDRGLAAAKLTARSFSSSTSSRSRSNSNASDSTTATNGHSLSIEETATMIARSQQVHSFHANGQIFTLDVRYRLLKSIGTGAYGAVIAAKDSRLDQSVAVKKITNIFDDLVDAKRILREVRLLGHFKHKNITRLLDLPPPISKRSFEDVYIITELMETDLHQVIYSMQPMSDDHIKYFLYQMLCALYHIHSAGVLHRDIKPSNILLNSNCDLKVCDFGLARGGIDTTNDTNTSLELTEYVVTRWYRAPEIMLNCLSYTAAVDMWAIGCIFAEMIAREPLFPGNDYIHQLKLIINFLGTPKQEDIEFVKNSKALRFLTKLPIAKSQKFHEHFTTAASAAEEINPLALDLLQKMLVFNPSKRISVWDALHHPYLATFYDAEDFIQAPKFDFTFDIPDEKLSKEALIKLLCQDIEKFHPLVKRPTPMRPPFGMTAQAS